MATEPQPKALTRKPVLLNKVEGSQEVVNMAAIVPKEDGVISVSEDRLMLILMIQDIKHIVYFMTVKELQWKVVLTFCSGNWSESGFGPVPEQQNLHCSQACVLSDHGSLMLLNFVHESCWTGNNGSTVLDMSRSLLKSDLTTPMVLLQGLRHIETVRVWLKRDSGQYWPSIYHAMPSPCSCMSFNPETRRLSIGLDNGTISEFILSEDYNKMTLVKSYQAHQSRVIMILFVLEMEWVLSTGQDKHFTWHCSESGQRLGGYRTSAGACGLQFDVETRHVFVGDHSGQVTILKLEQESCSLVTTFKGHTGGVTALCWDPIQRVLFSGSSDHSIIMWDIGGRKGTAIELQGHNDKVQSLSYAHHTRQLISCGADGGIVVWNMDVERQETPEWLDSDSCQKCDQPFFWNFKQMWDSKKIGLRQHHCRKCGKAVCGKCSSKRSSIPLMGFEFEVRVCNSCHESITDEERAPTATFHDSKHNIVHVHFDATRGWLLTSGTDKVIKLWDMTPVVS
ncbi:WD repeat and FYVE domain-containing protein 1 [Willisornis vidua]|uniref:WD repeat and FYVE domain-containing protein 1 n=1 Tax=Willisornis vidua TaxID=1566151 RepID=A0ABQ9DGQ3_9PASS|nr:WD repeat and FYVE domain-containing protein 1 [Willisornis vidua]